MPYSPCRPYSALDPIQSTVLIAIGTVAPHQWRGANDEVRVALRDRSRTPLDGDVRRRLLLGGARAGEGRRGGRLHARVLRRAPLPRSVLRRVGSGGVA